MAELRRFRDLVTKYRKPYTQAELERAIGLSVGELSHRLHDNGRQPLTRQNVLDIVVTLAEWQGVTWKEAVELLEVMEYPLDTFEWKRRLQEHISSPDISLSSKASPLGLALEIPERMLLQSSRHLFHLPNRPEGYIPRLDILQEIKRRVMEEAGDQTIGITTALRGAGGFGKTTLALALCHDPEIQAAFSDILWIELGEQPPRSLELLNRLLSLYEESSTKAITLQEAQERWHVALRDRACLLVIDDVWQQEALSPLLQGGVRCRHLVTTRNDILLPRSAIRVVVDAMTLPEAVQVLCRDNALSAEIAYPCYRSQLEVLADRLGCWPLLLTLARGMLTDLVIESHATIAEALSTLAEAYQTRGVTAFRLDNVEERQRTVDACLSVSLHHLETFTHAHYHAIEHYQELAVFPEDTDIPLATLQIYWKGTGGLEVWETKDLCIRLYRLSLLLTCDLGTGKLRLHDVVRSYLIQRAGEQVPALHQHLLQAYQQHYHLKRWAELPLCEGYLWQYLAAHLCQANNQETLYATLTDLLYVTHKVLYLGVSALEADLLMASSFFQNEIVEHASSFLTILHQTIMRIHHLLQQVLTKAEIGGLLLSHLREEEGLAMLKQTLERELPHPFLTAWHPLPAASSLALLRVLRGHSKLVNACAFSPDGQWIISASGDCTLKVWDAATGAERHTFSGHTSSVNACAFSPDGQWIVSASDDHTLKVWDAATRAECLTLTGHTHRVRDCAISPDGQWIVSVPDDHTLKVWNAATGAERHTLSGHSDWVNACAFSPDGQWIVSASSDQTLKVWDVVTGVERHTLSGHSDWVRACAFSPDGQWIISVSNDQTLKVWKALNGHSVLTFPVDGVLSGCAFHPDGEHLVAYGALGMYFLRLVL